MEKSKLVKLLNQLNENCTEQGDLEKIFREKYETIIEVLMCSYEDVLKKTTSIASTYDNSNHTYEWKYIILNFYILYLLNDELLKSDMEVLSVQEISSAKASLKNLISYGILRHIQPNLPHHVHTEGCNQSAEAIVYRYSLLKSTVFGFYNCIKYPNLRMLILPHFLQEILVATFQIAYCPLKKPTKSQPGDTFVMTEATYGKLCGDQKLFKGILENMSQSIHPAIFIKQTMILFQTNAPLWFKKSVSNILTQRLKAKKGIQHIALAMLEGSDNDITTTWRIIDVLTKLIMSCRKLPDFQENICTQVLNLLDFVRTTDRDLLIFERLVVSCTKCIYSEDKELCKVVFVKGITTSLSYFAHKGHKFRDEDEVTDDIQQTVRVIYGCFADDSVNSTCLPMELLKPLISVVFNFYHLTVKSTFQTTSKELRDLLIKYMRSCTTLEIHQLLDNFLFGFTVKDVLQFRSDIIVEVDAKIVVKSSPHAIIYATAEVLDTVFNLLDTGQKVILFGYLLKCITDKEKYFSTSYNSKELLDTEDLAEGTVLQRLLAMHKLLSQLSENKDVQQSLKDKPDDIIQYINEVLSCETRDSQLIFIIVMILDNLVSNSSLKTLKKFQVVKKSLSTIVAKNESYELKCLCNRIITTLNEENKQNKSKVQEEMSEFEKALEDVYDPLLPVRGHGLLVLSKLIQKRDKQAMERKQYLLNLFQLYLKEEDSFIYLNAVQGLAAMADHFPDTVIEILCEEFADFAKKDDGIQETRMKLGEVLVRVIKSLGEMAPKYKALLLNTFLATTKDDDHLIRSSSLSNLGEVCRVLNYKLGTIVTEILVCVHAIIATDKAVEARRAAVTVIRQLFVGLQSEMISFLKEDILPIYRTLKEIYNHDKDDVMRLQAQLALEELNENMKNFVFPNPELNLEKKIIILN